MPQQVHVIVCTHTERHLRLVLEGLVFQNAKPDTVSLVTDGRVDAVSKIVHEYAARIQAQLYYTTREHQGIMRLSQTRNNAVRTLNQYGIESGRIVFIDGDMLLDSDSIQKHAALGKRGELLIADRIYLSEKQTAELYSADSDPLNATKSMDHAQELARLDKRNRKATKHSWMRKLGIAKKARPQLVGAQISVDYQDFLKVNGFDEEYEGYGSEDDDFAARLYKSGIKPRVAVKELTSFHLWHPTQAPQKWRDSEGAKRFLNTKTTVRAKFGFDNPMPSNATTAYRFN